MDRQGKAGDDQQQAMGEREGKEAAIEISPRVQKQRPICTGKWIIARLVLWAALPPSKALITIADQGTGNSYTTPCRTGFDPSQPALHNYFPGREWHRRHGDGVFQTGLPALEIHPIPGYYLLITWLGSRPTLSCESTAGRVHGEA